MSAVFRIPVPIDIPISLTSLAVDGLMIVTISSNTNLSKLTWTISQVKPHKVTKLQEGRLLVISFRLNQVISFNLSLGAIQTEFIGSDILDYLVTSETGLGRMIQPQQPSFVPAMTVVGLFALIAAGFVATKSMKEGDHRAEEEDKE